MRFVRPASLATLASTLLTIAVLAAAVARPGSDTPAVTPTPLVISSSPPAAARLPTSLPTPPATPRPTRTPGSTATPHPAPSAAPSDIPSEIARNGPRTRVATRVVIDRLGIDLPVVAGRPEYPACNVAMYLRAFRQPGQGGPTYLYAHARTGMFLPLLTQSRISNGAGMLGMTVRVFTGDGVEWTYRIDRVYRHTTSLARVTARGGERLWLQTSEGPHGTIPKLQVTARYASRSSASYAASHPLPRPIRCG
ncbi:MAG TPA: hypothetical protein VKA85_07820 [Candidatus Limnocylindrales bacterium]|nr:hypothetical protein [Candidatus Limnocylindrales bacterium]